ncbi:hypothetical protein [Yinghuangia soli]|uniref:Uncharacterized protein n=1 Tax=Yinghuangia soli TaxID=2908204 RepID=A0AA41U834_9ACTN|nr:hypothetical protein [Yinghuangia soli]MCF2532499.1 hypothetical protein [Yinghuangia soli]
MLRWEAEWQTFGHPSVRVFRLAPGADDDCAAHAGELTTGPMGAAKGGGV